MAEKKQQFNSASSFGSFDIDSEQQDSIQTGLEAAGLSPAEKDASQVLHERHSFFHLNLSIRLHRLQHTPDVRRWPSSST